MPKPSPRGFRDDVVRAARNRDPGVTPEQVAADFGVHPMTLSKWLRQAAIDDGERPGVTTGEASGAARGATADQVVGTGERGTAPARADQDHPVSLRLLDPPSGEVLLRVAERVRRRRHHDLGPRRVGRVHIKEAVTACPPGPDPATGTSLSDQASYTVHLVVPRAPRSEARSRLRSRQSRDLARVGMVQVSSARA